MPEIPRAYKVVLDPNQRQLEAFARSAGAARAAYNYAVAKKKAAHKAYDQEVAELTYTTFAHLDPKRAEKEATIEVQALIRATKKRREDWLSNWKIRHASELDGKTTRQVSNRANKALRQAAVSEPQLRPSSLEFPSAVDIQKSWRKERGDNREDVDGVMPWWHEVSSRAFTSAFIDAQEAWKNWDDSRKGKRAGRRVGYPRFKAKGRSRDSFRINHDVKKPGIRLEDPRHLLIPRIGAVRLQEDLRRLFRKQSRGLITVQSVTVSRRGHRWWASVLVVEQYTPRVTSRRQKQAGAVGVDVGVHHLAALSTGQILPNPRHFRRAAARLKKAQRALARTKKGSNGHRKAAARVARIQAQIAEQRTQYIHQITKQLVTLWSKVCLEDLNVVGMTASARGTIDKPGRQVRQKAGLNRSILDAAFGEFARQIEYKAPWYGSQVAEAGRYEPTSQTCSACGARLRNLTLKDRTITCPDCGYTADRDINAARNILAVATELPLTELPDGGGHPTVRLPAKPKPAPGPRRHRRRPTPTTSGTPEAHIGMPAEPRTATAAPGKETGRPPGSPPPSNGRAFPLMRESTPAGHSP